MCGSYWGGYIYLGKGRPARYLRAYIYLVRVGQPAICEHIYMWVILVWISIFGQGSASLLFASIYICGSYWGGYIYLGKGWPVRYLRAYIYLVKGRPACYLQAYIYVGHIGVDIYVWVRVGQPAICEHIYIWLRVGQPAICGDIYF